MELMQTIVLSLVQGISEFLPISSSAHLILVPKLTDWEDQGLAFDVVVHLGTLTAVIFYYRQIISRLLMDFYYSVVKTTTVGESKLAWGILLGTIPVGIFGLLFKEYIASDLRSVSVITYTTLLFGALLGIAIIVNNHKKSIREILTWADIGFIGLMQAVALIPGVSRSGITITAGLLIGLSKKATTQFAFLLSIPVITLSAMLILIDLYQQHQAIEWGMLLLGFVLSALSAYVTITLFIRALDTMSMMPFVIYRLILGVFLLFL